MSRVFDLLAYHDAHAALLLETLRATPTLSHICCMYLLERRQEHCLKTEYEVRPHLSGDELVAVDDHSLAAHTHVLARHVRLTVTSNGSTVQISRLVRLASKEAHVPVLDKGGGSCYVI